MGGIVTGPDPACGVTDAYGRVHRLDNVYVADGHGFVIAGARNPASTIMAVAPRRMRHVARAGGAGGGWVPAA
jgi:choline dehydrogenase-like flavoprotein